MKFKIINVENNRYCLLGEDKKEYEFYLAFYDIEVQPNKGDSLVVSDVFLKTMLHNKMEYYFGDLASIYGREIKEESDEDFVVLTINGKKHFLKRLYG